MSRVLLPNKLRRHVLDMVYRKQSGHIGGSFSIAEMMAYLFTKYDLAKKDGTDKFILSKGHAAPMLYAALYESGAISRLDDFREVDSPLQGHPDLTKLPEVGATTGSLGQGLSIAVGMALAKKLGDKPGRVFCCCGDGEIQEGQVWEAMMMAPKYSLDNLIVYLDKNGLQNEGATKSVLVEVDIKPIAEALGWQVFDIDGHNIQDFERLNWQFLLNKPKLIIMNTVKGKGVSFMENNNKWHSKAPSEEEYLLAVEELDKATEL